MRERERERNDESADRQYLCTPKFPCLFRTRRTKWENKWSTDWSMHELKSSDSSWRSSVEIPKPFPLAKGSSSQNDACGYLQTKTNANLSSRADPRGECLLKLDASSLEIEIAPSTGKVQFNQSESRGVEEHACEEGRKARGKERTLGGTEHSSMVQSTNEIIAHRQ